LEALDLNHAGQPVCDVVATRSNPTI
jgi:hypothetical protein